MPWNAINSLHVLLLPGTGDSQGTVSFVSFKCFVSRLNGAAPGCDSLALVRVMLPSVRTELPGASTSARAACPFQRRCKLPLSSTCGLCGIHIGCAYRIHVETTLASPVTYCHKKKQHEAAGVWVVFQRAEEVKDPSRRRAAKNGFGWGQGQEKEQREGLGGDAQHRLLGWPDCN